MSGHTKWPWSQRRLRGDLIGAIDGADGCLVATTGYRTHPESNEDDANARLIAAAPELLDALKSLKDRLDECAANPDISAADAYDSFYRDLIADAIAKAQP